MCVALVGLLFLVLCSFQAVEVHKDDGNLLKRLAL